MDYRDSTQVESEVFLRVFAIGTAAPARRFKKTDTPMRSMNLQAPWEGCMKQHFAVSARLALAISLSVGMMAAAHADDNVTGTGAAVAAPAPASASSTAASPDQSQNQTENQTQKLPADQSQQEHAVAKHNQQHAGASDQYMPTNWNDTYIGYRWGPSFHYPGVPHQVQQNIGYLDTVGGFKYGSYAFNVDYLKSSESNPEVNGTGGAQEVYSVGRVEWSLGKILGHPVSYGVIRDFGVTTGFEWGTKNDAFAERARMLILGGTVEFAVPRGFWNLTIGARKESNYNGITGQDVDFNVAAHIESSWLIPFQIGSTPFLFRGFASSTAPKGRDGFGVETTTEFLFRTAVLADVGSFFGVRQTFYAGLGYEYWYHAYGTPTSEITGTKTSTPMVQFEMHF